MKMRLCAIVLLVAVLLACCWGCGNDSDKDWSSGIMQGNHGSNQNPNTGGSNGDTVPDNHEQSETEPGQEPEETQSEELTSPTREPLEVTQRMDTSYEKLLAAGVLMGLSIQYPDFQLEELCFKEEHEFEEKMESEGVYAFFQSNGESLCIQAKPLAELRNEDGVCDLQENVLGYATFDLVDVQMSELTDYISVMDEDLSEQISQLYLLTIIEN